MWIADDLTPLPGPAWAQLLGVAITAVGAIVVAYLTARKKDRSDPTVKVDSMVGYLQSSIDEKDDEIKRLNKKLTDCLVRCARCEERWRRPRDD